MTYADLEIRILDRQPDGYPVEITLNSEQQFPRGLLDPGFLSWTPSASPAADGERLFQWLLADPKLLAAWSETRGQQPERRIRLRVDASAPELHALPWELLRDTVDSAVAVDLAASTATPFSRYLAGRWLPGSPVLQRPIKVLVAIANPTNLAEYDLPAIDVEQEWASLQQAAAGQEVELVRYPPAPGGSAVRLQTRDGDWITVGGGSGPAPCTLAGIEAELLKGYHVLHFVGHGAFDPGTGQAVLFLADDQNRVSPATDQEMAEMLARQLANVDASAEDKLRLVFLQSCQSATRSPADAFRGLAPRLVAAGVPAVLAMQDLVPVDTARQFAATFYRQLVQHGQVDLACNEARSGLLTARLPGAAIPVLFMRLRNGQLLGQRGRITSERESMFWPFLLENIDQGLCTAILGPRVAAGLLPPAELVAEKLADKYGYPLPDRQNFARVAQYIAVTDPDVLRTDYLRLLQRSLFDYLGIQPTEEQKRRFAKAGLSETADALNWAEAVQGLQEAEVHRLLAGLPLALYVTTNPDNFMALALKASGRPLREVGPRWEQPQAGTPQWVLTPPPSPDQPVVFHLNGYDADPDQRSHLVLSEDDYMAHVVRLSRDQETILPMNVLRMLSEHSFLFLGYDLEDWQFRTVLQGLIKPIAQTNRGQKMHVGVQLDVDNATSVDRARTYLARYLGQFNIDIYWGTPQQFAAELHSRWQAFEAGGGW